MSRPPDPATGWPPADYDPTGVYVHPYAWEGGGVVTVPGGSLTVWNAQRPLRGYRTWEAANRYGRFYAATAAPRDDDAATYNQSMDARRVYVVNNLDVTRLFDQARPESHTFADYIRGEIDPAEAVAYRELPWHAEDTSADDIIARIRQEAGL